MPRLDKVYIAFGSNLGDRRSTFAAAARELASSPGLRWLSGSHVYESMAWPDPSAPAYLNAVASLACSVPPHALLERLLRVEASFGRQRDPTARWAPRTLDLDLLVHGQACLRDAILCLPHPRLSERRFVLEPLAELAPELVHPVLGKTMAELLASCPDLGPCVRQPFRLEPSAPRPL